MFDQGVVATVVLALLGAMVWGVRLEGKLNALDQAQHDLKELILSKLDAIRERLVRIEGNQNGRH